MRGSGRGEVGFGSLAGAGSLVAAAVAAAVPISNCTTIAIVTVAIAIAISVTAIATAISGAGGGGSESIYGVASKVRCFGLSMSGGLGRCTETSPDTPRSGWSCFRVLLSPPHLRWTETLLLQKVLINCVRWKPILRLPGAFSGRISLPFDKEESSTACASGIENLIHVVLCIISLSG